MQVVAITLRKELVPALNKRVRDSGKCMSDVIQDLVSIAIKFEVRPSKRIWP